MNRLFIVFLLIFMVSLSSQTKTSSEESLEILKTGNQRFHLDELAEKNFDAEVAATAEGQNPHAIVVACSDSRVAPEIIFDKSIGKVFVIRLAGNVVDTAAIGSIEYAVKYLGSSYLLVLGHTSCGAVEATVKGGEYSPAITAIAKMIMPAYEKTKSMNVDESQLLNATIAENVHLQIENLVAHSEIVAEHINDGSLKIGGGVYDIATGKVDFFEE